MPGSLSLVTSTATSRGGALPEKVNDAAKLKEPETKGRKFEEVVKSAERAVVLVY